MSNFFERLFILEIMFIDIDIKDKYNEEFDPGSG